MKTFFVFFAETYYPNGGMGDFVESFKTQKEDEDFIKEQKEKNEDFDDISKHL